MMDPVDSFEIFAIIIGCIAGIVLLLCCIPRLLYCHNRVSATNTILQFNDARVINIGDDAFIVNNPTKDKDTTVVAIKESI